jgi:multidrug resistance protein, MATE family
MNATMTWPGSLITAGARAPAQLSVWRLEFIETVRLAVPMALTQLGQVAMMTTDLALIGRLGDEAVAAAALAHTVFFSAFVLGLGLVSAVAPLAAQAHGAREPRRMRRALRVGLWAALAAGIPLIGVALCGEELLLMTGQNATTAALAGRYLDGLAFSMVPAWCFIALRSFMGAVNRPEPALWITLAAIPANAALAYALIHGEFGLPALDLFGAGLATTAVDVGMCVAGVWIACTRPPFRKYRVLGRFWHVDLALARRLAAIGLPISGSIALEFGLFAAAALLMGRLGTTALAAHQIALQVASALFMVPLGISFAATVRVGQAVGRRDGHGARRAGFAAILIGGAFMATMTLVVAATRRDIPAIFLGTDAASAETARLVASLLALGASFFIFDGIQTVANGALRGRNDTRVPLLIAAVSFWAIGFPASYGFGFPVGLGPSGVWIGLTIGLTVYATLLVWRFHALTRSGRPVIA